MKKTRNTKRKLRTVLLATTITLTAFSQCCTTAHAALLPTANQFATKLNLGNFDTAHSTTSAKIYFGNSGDNRQKWWIVGDQNKDGLILFADEPLMRNVVFDSSRNKRQYEGKKVNANHWGASEIRKMLKELETNTSYFSKAEQKLMNETTIYTDDTLNNSVYSTTDKLYLAYGDMENNDGFLKVGKNTEDNINSGLRITGKFWGAGTMEWAWLRAPGKNVDFGVLCAIRYNTITQSFVNSTADIYNGYIVKPAFELNMSSVIFASAAPAVSTEGKLKLQNVTGDGAFTLRYSTNTIGSALISYDKTKVKLTNVPANTYLVVQNRDGAWAKTVAGTTSILAQDMGLDNFENCKVWLETTDFAERKTYATLATSAKAPQKYSVKVTGNTSLNITSNNETQKVTEDTEIQEITFEPVQDYYFPENYIDSIQGLTNGLFIKKTKNGFTIFGTPTADINIILPEATVIPKIPDPIIPTENPDKIENIHTETKYVSKRVNGYHVQQNPSVEVSKENTDSQDIVSKPEKGESVKTEVKSDHKTGNKTDIKTGIKSKSLLRGITVVLSTLGFIIIIIIGKKRKDTENTDELRN